MRLFSVLLIVFVTMTACSSSPISSLPAADPATPASPGGTGEPSVIIDPPLNAPTEGPAMPTSPPPSGGEPMPTFEPVPGDSKLTRGTVTLNSASLLILESYPVQVQVELNGYLPNPCHQLRVSVNPPDSNNRIEIEVYSVYDPEMMCIEVIKEFETSVSLGSYPPGHYQVFVNNELAGEFDS